MISTDRGPIVRVALVDGGSFVLPYDYQLAATLAGAGHRGRVPRLAHPLQRRAARGDAPPARRDGARPGALEHRRAALARARSATWRSGWACGGGRRRFDAVNLQFSAGWPLELPFLWALRRRLVFTVHNAVPHGFAGRRHGPTERIARLARHAGLRQPLLARRLPRPLRRVASAPSRGCCRSACMPVVPGLPPVPYRPAPPPEALVYWSTVKPYKGVELFAELARSKRLRDAGLGLEIHGAWAPELAAAEGGAGRPRRAHRGRLPRRAAPAAACSSATSSSSCPIARRPSRARCSRSSTTAASSSAATSATSATSCAASASRRCCCSERSADAVVDALERLRRDPAAIAAALQRGPGRLRLGRRPTPASPPSTPGRADRGRCHNRAAPPARRGRARAPPFCLRAARNPNRR